MQQTPLSCTENDKAAPPLPSLPTCARLPFNRCNLPAVILGSLTFQRHPATLRIDGVRELHRRLFEHLDAIDTARERALCFRNYIAAHFCLESLEEAGLDETRSRREKADYVRLLRGWLFDPDGRDAAVLKGWIESRFGLLTRYHGQPIRSPDDDGYARFLEMRARGLYATNAIEAQLDLLYEFCQYEMTRRLPNESHATLFRGVNRLQDYERLADLDRGRHILLLNNLNSFTGNRDRADEFGDYILQARVPLTKVFFFSELLPEMMKGEEEYMVIGGVYEVRLGTV